MQYTTYLSYVGYQGSREVQRMQAVKVHASSSQGAQYSTDHSIATIVNE